MLVVWQFFLSPSRLTEAAGKQRCMVALLKVVAACL